ncbi:hypothetical protein [Streptococcus thoraltensis]|uniref:hypothetical protein n=1 Tax=Streptococcus thoraltensis TaxID=55085 RepID=UPI000365B510|nr:hypothetical protein [Streptococcus thoraltensis]QBX31116.1 hypothetical protein Javan616_0023 [Streptococcus phage Javan616]
MAKIDAQMISLYKIKDTDKERQYSAISGTSKGIATVDKTTSVYSYDGDNLGKFSDFVKDTLTLSVLKGKTLPDKIVHGFG